MYEGLFIFLNCSKNRRNGEIFLTNILKNRDIFKKITFFERNIYKCDWNNIFLLKSY